MNVLTLTIKEFAWEVGICLICVYTNNPPENMYFKKIRTELKSAFINPDSCSSFIISWNIANFGILPKPWTLFLLR